MLSKPLKVIMKTRAHWRCTQYVREMEVDVWTLLTSFSRMKIAPGLLHGTSVEGQRSEWTIYWMIHFCFSCLWSYLHMVSEVSGVLELTVAKQSMGLSGIALGGETLSPWTATVTDRPAAQCATILFSTLYLSFYCLAPHMEFISQICLQTAMFWENFSGPVFGTVFDDTRTDSWIPWAPLTGSAEPECLRRYMMGISSRLYHGSPDKMKKTRLIKTAEEANFLKQKGMMNYHLFRPFPWTCDGKGEGNLCVGSMGILPHRHQRQQFNLSHIK